MEREREGMYIAIVDIHNAIVHQHNEHNPPLPLARHHSRHSHITKSGLLSCFVCAPRRVTRLNPARASAYLGIK